MAWQMWRTKFRPRPKPKATNVEVTEQFPNNIAVTKITPAFGTRFNQTATGGVWSVPTIAPGTSKVLTIVAQATSASVAYNTVTVTHSDVWDPVSSNNSARTPTDPQQADVLRLSPVARDQANMWSWSSSEATYESKAFQYWSPKSMLAVPLSTYRYAEAYENGRYTWSYQHISKLMLVEVNETDGNLSMYGEVNHSSFYDGGEENRYWGWGEQNIRRSIFMGDFVYAISPAGITATNLTTMEESSRLSIPYSSVYDWYVMDDMVEVEDGGDRADDGDDVDRSDDRDRDDGDGEDRPEDSSDDADEEPPRTT